MKNNPGGTSGRIITAVWRGVAAVESGRTGLDDYLDSAAVPPEIRRSAESALFLYYRNKCFVDGIIRRYCRSAPSPDLRAFLAAALTQQFFQSGIAPQSAANVAVETAKTHFSAGAVKFVNALLRRGMREMPRPPEPRPPETILPPAVLRRWRRNFGEDICASLADLYLRQPPFTFRMIAPENLPGGCEPVAGFGPFRFGTGEPAAVLNSAGFAAGGIYIQDPAASLAPSLAVCGTSPGRILDMCAAPGGKTLMLHELFPSASLTAADRSAARQKLTAENLSRRNIAAEIIAATPEQLTGSFDLVLADVPCSNTGVFRHRPDALWRFSESALRDLLPVQKRILNRAAELTEPGGVLIYSTCSIEPEENTETAGIFMESHPEFTLISERRLMPAESGDGAYAVCWMKNR